MDDPGQGASGGSGRPLFQSRRRRPRSGGPGGRWIGGLLLLLVVIVTAWLWWRSQDQGPARSTQPPEPDTALAVPAEPALTVPPLDESDPVLREVLATLSDHPEWARWLVPDDLVRRFVVSVVNVGEGESPRDQVEFLDPEGPFAVRETAEGVVADPASHDRYDVLVEAFVSLDTEQSARFYRLLHPLFEEAHAELGLPDRTFDESFAYALGNLLAVQIPPADVGLVQNEAVYEYRDPSLEGLSPADKHLLRLGPENARRVQEKLRDVASAIGVQPRPPSQRGG